MTDFMMGILCGIGLGTGINMILSAIFSARRAEERKKLRMASEEATWRKDIEFRLGLLEEKFKHIKVRME